MMMAVADQYERERQCLRDDVSALTAGRDTWFNTSHRLAQQVATKEGLLPIHCLLVRCPDQTIDTIGLPHCLVVRCPDQC